MANINTTAYRSPNYSGKVAALRFIVLHHTAAAGNGEGVAAYLCRPSAGASANYLVCKDGTIYELVSPGYAAWHAGTGSGFGIPANSMNNYSIGIEIQNLGNGVDPYPPAQLKALDELIAYLDGRFGKLRIIDHKMWAPGRKVDMSANFPLDSYIKYRKHKAPSSKLFLAHMDAEAAIKLASLANTAGYAVWVEGAGQFYVGALNTRDALRYIGEQEKSVSEKFTGRGTNQYAVIAIHAAATWMDSVAVPFAASRNAANITYDAGDGTNGFKNMVSALADMLINGNKIM